MAAVRRSAAPCPRLLQALPVLQHNPGLQPRRSCKLRTRAASAALLGRPPPRAPLSQHPGVLLCGAPLMLALPGQVQALTPALIERDEQVRTEIPEHHVHPRRRHLLLQGSGGAAEVDAPCGRSRGVELHVPRTPHNAPARRRCERRRALSRSGRASARQHVALPHACQPRHHAGVAGAFRVPTCVAFMSGAARSAILLCRTPRAAREVLRRPP